MNHLKKGVEAFNRKIIRRTLEDPISTHCPSTILRTHPDVTVYLDLESAAELNGATWLD